MKEQDEERHVESEETTGETARRIREAQKTQLTAEPKLKQSPQDQPPKPQAQVRLTFKIPVKSAKHFEISRPPPPSLKIKPHISIKPTLLPLEAWHATIIAPTISTAPKAMALSDIRFPTLTPITMSRPATLSLGLMLKRPLEISLRPLVYPEPSKGLGILKPLIKPARVAFQRPPTFTTPLKRGSATHVPSIHVAAPIGQSEKIAEIPAKLVKEGKLPPPIPTEATVEGEVSEETSPEFPSPFESLCDERYLNEDYRKSGGLGSVSSEGLICILVDKSRDFHELVGLLCTKLWRIKSEEGLPQTSITSYNEEVYWRGLSDVTELDRAQILIEDLTEKTALNKVREEFINQVKAKSVEGRLRFLLLPIDVKLFDKAYYLLTKPDFRVERYLRNARFLAYKLKSVDEEFLGRLLVSAFGFVDTPIHSASIGEYAIELHGKLCMELERIIQRVQNEVHPTNWPKPGERESWLHWALKHLTYMHLINNEKMDENDIKSEEPVDGMVADVKAPGIAIEIETMYGTRDPIGAKINPKIKSYWEKGFKDELWLIIPNLHALLYANSLLRLRKGYRERPGRRLDLEIYVADVTGIGARLIYNQARKPGLVKLVDVLKYISEPFRNSRGVS